MSQSPSVGRSALKAFRLSDVSTDLRLKAARTISNRRNYAMVDDELKPEDRLFSILRANVQADVDTFDHEGILQVAREPSDRVYWISRAAWDRVMGAPP